MVSLPPPTPGIRAPFRLRFNMNNATGVNCSVVTTSVSESSTPSQSPVRFGAEGGRRQRDGWRESSSSSAAAVEWSDLPPELWELIGRRLESRVDLLRFRSVCSTWRSLVSRLPPIEYPIPVPGMRDPVTISSASICPATIFRLESVPETSRLDGPFPRRQRWLIRISEHDPDPGIPLKLEWNSHSDLESEPKPKPDSNSRRMRLLNPLCSLPILCEHGTFPKNLDLLKFRVTEICREYGLRDRRGVALAKVKLLGISPNSPWRSPEDTIALAIFKFGYLRYWKHGQERWNCIRDEHHQEHRFHDIIVHKGRFYMVDKLGIVSWMDSSMSPVQLSPPIPGGGDTKHLVEWGGDIFVVDRHVWTAYSDVSFKLAADFKVYRLDQERGEWEEVTSIGDAVFFLGTCCSFSVSARDLDGYPGNCIYFTEVDRFGRTVNLFSLEKRSIDVVLAQPFQPLSQILGPLC